uniref:Uncharacterized protein n=1 Tax=Hordeum vulgare subsp. vulgare TaxID=112509 RepID=A0A8I6XQV9_HORVV
MDPHPTPFRAKRKPAAAPAKTPATKPKFVTTARGKATTSTASSAVSAAPAPQPRPRRAFGTVRSSNSLAQKPAPPPPPKHSKLSPPPPHKPLKVSPPKLQKPAAKVSPPPQQKPSKLSPPIPAKAARPSHPAEKPLKKAAPGPTDLAAKAKKKSQRVSFQDDVAAVAAPGSGEKVEASAQDSAGHTPMAPVKAPEKKPAKVVAAETPFFSAQNCSSCMLDQLESASYWLVQIHLAESVGKHRVSAAFFHLAFECQAQPFRRIQSELRNYVARHESAGTLTPSFHELLLAHPMAVNQLKFDTDGSEKVDKTTTTDTADQKLDDTTLVHECSERDCGGDLVDVREAGIVIQGEEEMDQPSFEQKLDEIFEFDDCEAVIVDRLAEEHSEFEKIIGVKGPCDSETVQSACRSSIDRLSLKGSHAARGASERRLSSESHLDKLSPSAAGSLSAKRSSSGSPFNNSPFCRGSLKRLTSSCPSSKKSSAKGGLSSKRMSSGGCSDGEHDATAGAGDSSRVIQEGESGCHILVEAMELKEHGEYDDAAIDETR